MSDGIANNMALIYVGVVVSSFAGMSFRTISATKSNIVVRVGGLNYCPCFDWI
jgi:hypothetical protein